MGLNQPPGDRFVGASGFNGNIFIGRNHGFRAFRYHADKSDLATSGRLTSLVYTNFEWGPGVNKAVHLRNHGSWPGPMQPPTPYLGCPFPHKGCSHGFYAYYDEDYFEPTSYNHTTCRINGVVDGFGRCVIGEKGYRAEYAVIVAFTKPYGIACDFQRQVDLDLHEIDALVTRFLETKFPAVPIFDSVADLKAAIPLPGRPPRNDADYEIDDE